MKLQSNAVTQVTCMSMSNVFQIRLTPWLTSHHICVSHFLPMLILFVLLLQSIVIWQVGILPNKLHFL